MTTAVRQESREIPGAGSLLTGNEIVVGVDGSAAGRRALRWAVREARRRGDHVVAAIAWRWDIDETADTFYTAAADEAARTVAREVQALSNDERGGVRIDISFREGRPADVLTALADRADLLVIGSHGHSHQLQQVLGSVAEECVRNARCPVVVIPVGYPD